MIDRIVDISEGPVRLKVDTERLFITKGDAPPVSVPLDEVSVLVLGDPSVALTHGVLSGIAERNGVVVVSSEKRLPNGMLLPLVGHHTQVERFRAQADAPLPLCKQAWKQLAQAKIRAQARTLTQLYGDDRGLGAMAARVRSGDAGNLEGLAAQRYWPALFPQPGFRRDTDAPDQNRLLNYGYAVQRAIAARAICAAGLHPSLGIHHHNKYSGYPLADDLMEPFRPRVDKAVVQWTAQHGPDAPLDRGAKAALIQEITGRLSVENEELTMFHAAARLAVSLAQMFEGSTKKLVLPTA